MLKRAVVAVGCLVLLASAAYGFALDADLRPTTLMMEEVGGLVAAYNDANGAGISYPRFGWGGELRMGFIESMRVHPVVGVRGVIASSGTDREAVTTSAAGAFAGIEISLGAWSAAFDLGAYRSQFDFSAGGYDDLSGWSAGGLAMVAYRWKLTRLLRASVGLTVNFLQVSELKDREGGLYGSRTGAILDFSGFGLTLGIGWNSP